MEIWSRSYRCFKIQSTEQSKQGNALTGRRGVGVSVPLPFDSLPSERGLNYLLGRNLFASIRYGYETKECTKIGRNNEAHQVRVGFGRLWLAPDVERHELWGGAPVRDEVHGRCHLSPFLPLFPSSCSQQQPQRPENEADG
jgi:hypothetical protein